MDSDTPAPVLVVKDGREAATLLKPDAQDAGHEEFLAAHTRGPQRPAAASSFADRTVIGIGAPLESEGYAS